MECEVYGGGRVTARTLQAAPASLGDPTRILPSRRYLRLMQEGARHHGLHPDYVKTLESLPYFQPPRTLRKGLGWLMSACCVLVIAVSAMPLMMLLFLIMK